jgi:hypothetical protein
MAFRGDLVAKANELWKEFGKDEGRNDKFIGPGNKTTAQKVSGGKKNPRKETVEPFASRVGDFWLAIPTADYNNLVKKFAKALGKLDGTIDLPWSAAFISYCMQMSGAGPSFPYAAGHSAWIIKSIANRKNGKMNAALVGFKPGEIELQVGDLVGKPRQAGITYDNAVKKGFFTSHSDIVVEIDKARKVAFVIGGNVGQTVARAEVAITADGKLKAAGGWIVHIQNNITPKPATGSPTPVAKAIAAAEVG